MHCLYTPTPPSNLLGRRFLYLVSPTLLGYHPPPADRTSAPASPRDQSRPLKILVQPGASRLYVSPHDKNAGDSKKGGDGVRVKAVLREGRRKRMRMSFKGSGRPVGLSMVVRTRPFNALLFSSSIWSGYSRHISNSCALNRVTHSLTLNISPIFSVALRRTSGYPGLRGRVHGAPSYRRTPDAFTTSLGQLVRLSDSSIHVDSASYRELLISFVLSAYVSKILPFLRRSLN
jgi:hypothetical protein